MKRLFIAAAIAALAAAPAFASDHGEHHGGHHKHWTYAGDTGPAHWAELKDDYATCGTGKSQSPIDISTAALKHGSQEAIAFHYAAASKVKGSIVNNGHTVKVNTEHAGFIEVDGKRYDLKQFHFHSPSENQVDGKPYAMVAHFVHASAKGELAVVAVMFQQGKANKALTKVWSKLPQEVGDKAGYRGLDLAAILPADRTYYHFTGSLTTPPCSENVNWMILKTPVTIGAQQLKKFHALYNGNVRPVNPMNGRSVTTK